MPYILILLKQKWIKSTKSLINVRVIKQFYRCFRDINFDTTTQEYVEIIYDLQKNNKVARVKDIAKNRGVTRSSVSIALKLLKKRS